MDGTPQGLFGIYMKGRSVAFIARSDGWGDPIPNQAEQAIGDRCLLIFAAVALQRYEELNDDYRMLYAEEVQSFIQCLTSDGFRYDRGVIHDPEGQVLTPEPAPRVNSQQSTVSSVQSGQSEARNLIQVEPSQAGPELSHEETADRQGWSRGEKIAAWALAIAFLTFVAALLVVPEFRKWLRLDKPGNAMPTEGAIGLEEKPNTPSNTVTGGARKTTPSFTIYDEQQRPLAGVDVLIVKPDGTHLKTVVTDEQGSGQLEERVSGLATIFCARPDFHQYYKPNVALPEGLPIKLKAKADGGAVIIPDGTGYIPGLDGRLNPILDTEGRTYLYAENIAIEGGKRQPVSFTTNRPFQVRDRHGHSFQLRVISIIGSSSLIEYSRIDESKAPDSSGKTP
jgi:hypothetical protein